MLENVKLVLFTLTLAANIQTLRSCARTKPGGGNSPTAPNPCINPSDTSGVINAVSNSNINSQNQAVGTCTCTNGLKESFYKSQNANPSQDIADLDVQCKDMSQFCACDASGKCFTRKGSLTDVQLFSHCESGTCTMYALLIGDNDSDGVQSGSTVYTVGQQFDSNGNEISFSPSSSTYFKPVSVSCSGCSTIQGATCRGPYKSA